MTARSRPAARLLAALLLAAAFAAPPPVRASGPGPGAGADQHFRRGVTLYEESNHAAALVEFQRAYDIDPKFQVLFNIAKSHVQLQDYASALRTFERYLRDGGAKIGFKRRKEVEAEIATLSKRVATLTITTSEPGATVTVDDVEVGTTPLEPLTVSSGRRRITATLPGRSPATQIVQLAGGDEKAITLDIPAPPPTVVTREDSAPPPETAAEPSAVPVVVMWSLTGALVVGAVVTGAVALGASSDLEAELARFPGDADALASAESSAFGFGLATDILIGTSVAAAAVATYFTVELLSSSESPSTTPARASPASTTPARSARLVVHPRGVGVDGTF